jgi:pimeloyl-ACP methyl ester carboxylesterase
VLLIHSVGTNFELWGEAFEQLGSSHRVVAYDRRGYGKSAGEAVSDWHAHAEDAAGLIAALGLDQPVVVGWSSGGLIGLDLAVNHPAMVSGLVLIEPPLFARSHTSLGVLVPYLGVLRWQLLGNSTKAVRAFNRWTYTYRSGGCAYDRWPAAWRSAMDADAPTAMKEFAAGTGEKNLSREQLTGLACPVVVLTGALSLSYLQECSREAAGLIPGARLEEVAGACHAVHLDNPGALVQAVVSLTAGE